MTGLDEGSVTNLKTELKTEGSGKVYNISFDYAASGLRYKYAVNADSGAIVSIRQSISQKLLQLRNRSVDSGKVLLIY